MVFGEQTLSDAVPDSGTASYSGPMLATMVFNNQIDVGSNEDYFQWITGDADFGVDFGAGTFSLGLNGTVGAAISDTRDDAIEYMPQGSIFTATGGGTFDDGDPVFATFRGGFSAAAFTDGANNVLHQVQLGDAYRSANTIDGSFYGPNGEEVGGAFRMSSGEPDTRIDILGVFTGGK